MILLDTQVKNYKEYGVLLDKAMQAQRGGDIKHYSELTEQAEAVKAKINEAKSA